MKNTFSIQKKNERKKEKIFTRFRTACWNFVELCQIRIHWLVEDSQRRNDDDDDDDDNDSSPTHYDATTQSMWNKWLFFFSQPL